MKKTTYKTAVRVYLGTLLVLLSALPVAFYIYDPLQVFHGPWGRDWGVNSNMRLQAAGIINNYEFDSVVLGTSMLENTSADIASTLLGGRFVNLSLSGSQHYERSLVLQHALRVKQLKHVIYSLDSSYISPAKENPKYPLSTYDYLYDRNVLNDVAVYYNDRFLKCLIVWSHAPDCTGRQVSLDRPGAWYKGRAHAARFGGLDKWFSAKNSNQVRRAFLSIVRSAKQVGRAPAVNEQVFNRRLQETIGYLDETVLRHARANPNVSFYYVFPPYSRIRFSTLHQVAPLEARLHEEVVRYFARVAGELPNVQVFGYEDQDFLDDIANYKDPGHYAEPINTAMLHDMAEGQHEIGPENVESYLKSARDKALAFDLVGLAGKIEAYLNAKAH